MQHNYNIQVVRDINLWVCRDAAARDNATNYRFRKLDVWPSGASVPTNRTDTGVTATQLLVVKLERVYRFHMLFMLPLLVSQHAVHGCHVG